MRIFSRLHDTWMETMGIYMTLSEEPMARVQSMSVPAPLSVKTQSFEPMISMLHAMLILFACLSTVLLFPPCLGKQTGRTELVTIPVSWNATEWGEGGALWKEVV